MDRLIYVAMTGAKHTTQQQANIANNLANLSTPGFKQQLSASRAVQAVGGTGYQTRTYTLDQTTGSDFSPGPVQNTGRNLDVSVSADGFIAVQTPTGEAYTRNGAFEIDANGILRTQSGNAVIGDGGPITIPQDNTITIGTDGTINAAPVDNPAQANQVGRIKLVKPELATLDRGSDGLFRPRNGQVAQLDDTVEVTSGALEGSNVNAVEQLVSMINYQRNYDLQIQLVQNADQNARAAAAIMQLS
ncbi:MAG: flagellar basal-body rod protein FlgF [Burkholderiales bacterium]|nr:flagellar basal-body rod protein FlgF [Burkholderiales bacterium]